MWSLYAEARRLAFHLKRESEAILAEAAGIGKFAPSPAQPEGRGKAQDCDPTHRRNLPYKPRCQRTPSILVRPEKCRVVFIRIIGLSPMTFLPFANIMRLQNDQFIIRQGEG